MPISTTGQAGASAQRRDATPLQILTLELEGITAGDYLSWCRDADPPALEFGLRSISIHADPLGDTIIAILDWDCRAPAPGAAARAAGLLLSPEVRVRPAKGRATPSVSGLRVGPGKGARPRPGRAPAARPIVRASCR